MNAKLDFSYFNDDYEDESVKHYRKSISEISDKLAKLNSMTDDEWNAESEKTRQKRNKKIEAYNLKAAETCNRLEEYIGKVQSWEPPNSEFDGFKSFMLEQLSMTLDANQPIKKFGGVEDRSRQDAIESAKHALEYAKNKIAALKLNRDKAIDFIAKLNSSIPVPMDMVPQKQWIKKFEQLKNL